MPLGILRLLLFAFIAWAFIVGSKSARIVLGSLVAAFAIGSFAFPRIRIYLNIVMMIVGLFCFVYLISAGYAYNIRVFRHKKPHDQV
jgi:hypothetical protein